MAAARAFLLAFALLCFFLVGAPLQWLVARRLPRAAHVIPILFCRTLLAILRVRLQVSGTRVCDRPVLMAANHVSWIDILALGAVTPFCFLAKSEVGRWPVIAAFAEVQGTVFVDRNRRRSIPGANRTMAQRMRDGRPVLLFPEGTTRGDAEPGDFRSSHFAAARDLLALDPAQGEVDVQPIAIGYSSAAAAWIGDDDLASHVWRTLRAPPLTCAVGFARPLRFGRASDRKAIARDCRAAIVALLARCGACPAETAPAPAAPGDAALSVPAAGRAS